MNEELREAFLKVMNLIGVSLTLDIKGTNSSWLFTALATNIIRNQCHKYPQYNGG